MNSKEYVMPDGKKAVFEYDHDGIGKVTIEAMDMLMGLIADGGKRGEWVDEHENGHGYWVGTCNQCGKENCVDNFCPNCGARMNSSEKPNNCEVKICDTCRYYNSNIPCGSTPSACKEADKFAEEFVDGLKKLKPKDEPRTYITEDRDTQILDAWQVHHRNTTSIEDEPQTDCAWK